MEGERRYYLPALSQCVREAIGLGGIHYSKGVSEDKELKALGFIAQRLEDLGPDGQRRVLDYLEQRFGRGRCKETWSTSYGPAGWRTHRCSLLSGHKSAHVSADGVHAPEPEDLY